MDKYIVERVMNEALYMLENKSTVRDIAVIYNVSKSTVHKDLQERLRDHLSKRTIRLYPHFCFHAK